jgi:transcriptional regulator with XRE-family HTH domain
MVDPDPVMTKLRNLFEQSGLTLVELGTKMGYKPELARVHLWQFLNKTADPRLSMVRKFMAALGEPMASLFEGER